MLFQVAALYELEQQKFFVGKYVHYWLFSAAYRLRTVRYYSSLYPILVQNCLYGDSVPCVTYTLFCPKLRTTDHLPIRRCLWSLEWDDALFVHIEGASHHGAIKSHWSNIPITGTFRTVFPIWVHRFSFYAGNLNARISRLPASNVEMTRRYRSNSSNFN